MGSATKQGYRNVSATSLACREPPPRWQKEKGQGTKACTAFHRWPTAVGILSLECKVNVYCYQPHSVCYNTNKTMTSFPRCCFSLMSQSRSSMHTGKEFLNKMSFLQCLHMETSALSIRLVPSRLVPFFHLLFCQSGGLVQTFVRTLPGQHEMLLLRQWLGVILQGPLDGNYTCHLVFIRQTICKLLKESVGRYGREARCEKT